MGKDPAFLFYPGDYLRDTQCFNANTQVAYDRIICEHMRNTCISKKQLNFFTKHLSLDEKESLMMVLTEDQGGYKIDWVAESICKRRAYSESRRQNREKKKNKNGEHMMNICKTYDKHMENEIENENINKINSKKFNEIWEQYPKKVGKKEAIKHFKASVKTDQDWESINVAIKNYKNSTRVKNGYIQNASTWFNNWQDWIEYQEYDSDQVIKRDPTVRVYEEYKEPKWMASV